RLRPRRVERDRDVPLASISGLYVRTLDAVTGQQDALPDDQWDLGLLLRLSVDAALVQHLAARGRALLERFLDVGLLVDEPELEDCRLPDQSLGAGGILDAGKLDQDAVLALALNGRLGHPELVDAVPDGLQRRPHVAVPQVGQPPLGRGQLEAARGLV